MNIEKYDKYQNIIENQVKEHLKVSETKHIRVYPLTQETIELYGLHEALRPQDRIAE